MNKYSGSLHNITQNTYNHYLELVQLGYSLTFTEYQDSRYQEPDCKLHKTLFNRMRNATRHTELKDKMKHRLRKKLEERKKNKSIN